MTDEVIELKIHRIDFDITRNGDICARIWKDNDTSTFFHSDSHYLITRQAGDVIKYKTNTRGFNNIVIPQPFTDSYNSEEPIGKMMRRVHENFRVALNQAKNGVKTELTDYETDNYISDNFDEMQIFVDKVFAKVKASEDGFYKHLAKELDLKKSSRAFDPEDKIQTMGLKMYDAFKKNYSIARAD